MNIRSVSFVFVAVFFFLPTFAQAITSAQANSFCKDPNKKGITVSVMDVPPFQTKCVCTGVDCSASGFTDPSGKMTGIQGALGFMQQVLGLAQGIKSLFGGGAGAGAAAVPPPPQAPFSAPVVVPSTAQQSQLSSELLQGAQNNATTDQTPPPSTSAQILDSVFNKEEKKEADKTDTGEPSGKFLDAVSKGFGNITDTITEVTVGIVNPIVPVADTKGLGEKRSEVRSSNEGATIEINTAEDGTGVSGFYGVSGNETSGTIQPSLLGRLCVSRPWAGNLLSSFISPTFFDGLCNNGGYQVGQPLPSTAPVNTTQVTQQAKAQADAQKTVIKNKPRGISCTPLIIRQGAEAVLEFSCGTGERLLQTSGFRASVNDSSKIVRPDKSTVYGIICSNDFKNACEVQVVNPRVAIWADPASVSLGSRTLIYWNTEDVEDGSCTIKGPSFSETESYGGASTVALNDVSKYTITCTAIDGEPVSDSVTVELAL